MKQTLDWFKKRVGKKVPVETGTKHLDHMFEEEIHHQK